jgi:hypothetical protein
MRRKLQGWRRATSWEDGLTKCTLVHHLLLSLRVVGGINNVFLCVSNLIINNYALSLCNVIA